MIHIYRNIKYLILAVLLATNLTSCDLDVKPSEELQEFWNNEDDAWYALNAIYRTTMPGASIHADAFTDDVYGQFPWESTGSLFQQDGLSSTSGTGWDFQSIRSINLFLANIKNTNIANKDLELRMIAEAKTLRALTYLNLTTDFGKVPIIKEPLDYTIVKQLPRDPVDEVRKFIMEDLDDLTTIKDLPEEYSGSASLKEEKGRITRYGALAIKARAALFFGDYVTCEEVTERIITEGGFSLFEIAELSKTQKLEASQIEQYIDFATLGLDKDKFLKGMFNYESLWHDDNANPDNPEYILTRQYSPTKEGIDWGRYTGMRPGQIGGWASVTPTQGLVDAYWTADGKEAQVPSVTDRATAYKSIKADFEAYKKANKGKGFRDYVKTNLDNGTLANTAYMKEFRNRDARLYTSINIPFMMWSQTNYGDDYAYEWQKGVNAESRTGYNFRKVVSLTTDHNNEPNATADFPLIRYAEILLMYAEARTHNVGFDTKVQTELNKIRARCGMPNIQIGLSKINGLDLIRQERRIELSVEGLRAKDMSRYEDQYWIDHMQNKNITMPDGETVLKMNWSPRMRLRPIPVGAIDVNPALKGDQNPGYN